MQDDQLPFDHDVIDSAYIEQNEQAKRTLGRNKDLKEILRLLNLAGGFGKKRPLKNLAELLYADENPTHNDPFYEPEIPGHRKKGWNRLQNVLRGHSGVTEREASFFHEALRAGFGDEWADATSKESLVRMSALAFFAHAQTLGLPWPEGGLSPALAFEAMSTLDGGLAIIPAFIDAKRLGTTPGSQNIKLHAEKTDPVYASGSQYVLHVRGLHPDRERLIVFELSYAPLSFEHGNEPFIGFPISDGLADKTNATVKPEGHPWFEIAAIPGDFAFYALSAPADLDLGSVLEIDLTAERWNSDDVETLARRVRALRLKHPKTVRLARHGYRVA